MLTGKSKYTLHWFHSILAVLFPCLFLCILVCAYMMHASKSNVMEINSAITNHVQKNMDSRLKELNRYALTLGISSHNTFLKNLNYQPEAIPRQAYQLSDTLRDYLVTNNFINNTYIYYPQSNLVVGNNGCFAANHYYSLQEYPDSSNYTKWINSLDSAKGMSIQDLSFRNRQTICFIHRMETGNANTPVMVFEINYGELLQDFEPGDTTDVLCIGVLNKNHLIASVGNSDSLADIESLYTKWEQNKNNIIRIHDTYAFFFPSAVPDLTYMTIYTSRQLTKALFLPVTVALIGIVLCTLTGIAGAVYISIRNGRPMENLLTALGKKTTSEDDDYQFILNKFEQMSSSIFLASLLRENIQGENEIFAEAKLYGVPLESPVYRIVILASPGVKTANFSPEMDTLHNYLSLLKYNSLITSYHHRYVILFNSDDAIPEQELRSIIETLQAYAFPNAPSLAAVGNCCENMSEIADSYYHALSVLHNTPSVQESKIVFYTESEATTVHGNSDLMKSFSSLIYSGQFLKARQLFPQLCKEYLCHEDAKTEALRQNALTNLLIDAVYTICSQVQAAQEADALLKSSASKETYLQQADTLLKHLENFESSSSNSRTSIAAQAKQYIDEHFTDPMLGLYMISEQLGISNSYLSATFKKVYGINVSQYMNQLRIEQSKILILNTRKNIKEIAHDVGFSSDINFIRVFKKIENQTPSALRKQK